MIVTCPKCGYIRQPTDTTPDYECPQCHIIYEKYPLYLQRLAEAADKQAKNNIDITPLSLPNKIFMVIGLAIIINVFFSLTTLATLIVDTNFTVFHYLDFYFGVTSLGTMLAVIPALCLISLGQLWSRISSNKRLLNILMGGSLLYLIGGYLLELTDPEKWRPGLSLIDQNSYFFVLSNILIVCGGLSVLVSITILLLNFYTPIEE